MEIDKKQFKKMFPHLADELDSGDNREPALSDRPETEKEEKPTSGLFEGYSPTIIDFLRRCDNEKQAEEIITYLERKAEISNEYSMKLRRQLRDKGVRSFGPKKEKDYYLRQTGY